MFRRSSPRYRPSRDGAVRVCRLYIKARDVAKASGSWSGRYWCCCWSDGVPVPLYTYNILIQIWTWSRPITRILASPQRRVGISRRDSGIPSRAWSPISCIANGISLLRKPLYPVEKLTADAFDGVVRVRYDLHNSWVNATNNTRASLKHTEANLMYSAIVLFGRFIWHNENLSSNRSKGSRETSWHADVHFKRCI
jgi:hypothetical protein